MVASVVAPLWPGKMMRVSGVANSRMVWRQAPQGAQAAALRLTMTTARMRRVGP